MRLLSRPLALCSHSLTHSLTLAHEYISVGVCLLWLGAIASRYYASQQGDSTHTHTRRDHFTYRVLHSQSRDVFALRACELNCNCFCASQPLSLQGKRECAVTDVDVTHCAYEAAKLLSKHAPRHMLFCIIRGHTWHGNWAQSRY
jgi:hypothetical protein